MEYQESEGNRISVDQKYFSLDSEFGHLIETIFMSFFSRLKVFAPLVTWSKLVKPFKDFGHLIKTC